MGYSVSFYAKVGKGKLAKLEEPMFASHTYNLKEFFDWFLGQPLMSFHNKEAYELQEAISNGFKKFSGDYRNPCPSIEFLKKFEPENQWGTVLSALAFLAVLFEAAIKAPDAIVEIN